MTIGRRIIATGVALATLVVFQPGSSATAATKRATIGNSYVEVTYVPQLGTTYISPRDGENDGKRVFAHYSRQGSAQQFEIYYDTNDHAAGGGTLAVPGLLAIFRVCRTPQNSPTCSGWVSPPTN